MKNRSWWIYLLLFFISQLTAIGCVMGFSIAKYHQVVGPSVVIALFVANVLAILLFFLFRPQNITWASTVAGLRGGLGRRTLLVFLLAIPITLLCNIFQEVFFPDIPNLLDEETMKSIMYNPFGLITVAVLGPLSEELLFRGGVMNGLQRKFPQQGYYVHESLFCFVAVIWQQFRCWCKENNFCLSDLQRKRCSFLLCG